MLNTLLLYIRISSQQKFIRDFCSIWCPKSPHLKGALTVHYQREDKTVSQRTGHLTSYAKAK